jgi:hypothetical protein
MRQTGSCSSLLPDDFVSLLAEHGHSTVNAISQMVSTCARCHHDAVYPVVVLEGESWFGDSQSGKLKLAVYGLCEPCAALPDTILTVNKKLFEASHRYACD